MARSNACIQASKFLILFLVVFHLARDPFQLATCRPTELLESRNPVNHSLCQRLNSTPGTLWMQQMDTILEASHLDPKPQLYNLWMDLTPDLLQTAVLARPQSHQVQRIWEILSKRAEDPTASPLQVLVFGGSVTVGTGCSKDMPEHKCRWSSRLENFVNRWLGYDAVRIHNIATGGTSTIQALSVLKYWLYPKNTPIPDLIIHSYAVNDAYWGEMTASDGEEERRNALMPRIIENLNAFFEQVHESYPCQTPMVVYLDDYIGGNGQGALLGDTLYRMILSELASWQGNMAVSYAKMVQKHIWADPMKESAFSPHWKRGKNGKLQANPHFGWRGHQTIAWMFAYSALQMAVDHCHQQEWTALPNLKTDLPRQTLTTSRAQQLLTEPPPTLDANMTLDNVSKQWQKLVQERQRRCEAWDGNQSPPCTMAWIAAPVGVTPTPRILQGYLKPFVQTQRGWECQNQLKDGWSRKLGLVATGPNALIEFQFRNLTQAVKTLTMDSLKSYGEQWEGSLAEVVVVHEHGSGSTTLLNETISGCHTSQSSISYTNEYRLGDIPVGSGIRIQVRLVGGTTFKVTGMMLCRT